MEVVQVFSHLTLYYPTCVRTPEVHIELINDTVLHTRINRRLQFHRFEDSVLWPGNVSISFKGVVSMSFEKAVHRNWTNPLTAFKVNMTRADVPLSWAFEVTNITKASDQTDLVTFKPIKRMWYFIEVGYHVGLNQYFKGTKQHHQYTPVPRFPVKTLDIPNIPPYQWRSMALEIDIVVRNVPKISFGGILSRVPIGSMIEVTSPYGTVATSQFDDLPHLYIVTAGTGITAVLSLILYVLQMTNTEELYVLYFNKQEKDILFRDGLTSLMMIDERFTVIHFLTNASELWRGKRGEPSVETLSPYIPTYMSNTTGDCYCAVCGHEMFTKKVNRILEDVFKYPNYHLYNFFGR